MTLAGTMLYSTQETLHSAISSCACRSAGTGVFRTNGRCLMASPSPARADLIPRRVPRHPVAVPVDLTVLRSGVPDCIPGRSVDVGEGGLAAIVAGELRPGDSVGVEMRLPHANHPLMAKAVVRHQARLRCGLEFVGLSVDQRA